MNTLNIEGWRKAAGEEKSTPIGPLQFYVSEDEHLRLEQAEEQLRSSDVGELMIAVDMQTLHLQIAEDCAPLTDCKWRVYRGGEDWRGQFHLLGYSRRDGSLVYSNAVMIDQLG